jgi:alpha-glucosidase (family GH31 glycosyl hydrolase)
MEFPEDKTGFAEQEEYLVGSSLLVAPVLRAGANTVEVYFPGKQPWYDVESFKVSETTGKQIVGWLRAIASPHPPWKIS